MQKKQHNDSSKSSTSFRFSQSPQDKKSAQKARLKEKINNVILNYLVEEGFQASALALAQEAAIPLVKGDTRFGDDTKSSVSPRTNILSPEGFGSSPCNGTRLSASYGKGAVKGYASIEKRKQIKFLILRGDISEAIRVVSTYYPTVLDANNLLLFKLLRLNLIEMIRNHKSPPKPSSEKSNEIPSKTPSAGTGESTTDDSEREFLNNILTFVRENLLNKVMHSMDLLRQLEVTMSLLCFDFDHRKPAHQMSELPEDLRNLLNLSLRNECYRAVNKVILDLETSGPPERHYRGVSLNEVSLSSAQAKATAQYYQDPDDSDSSDVEINPGPDVIKSIESMISSVPELSFQVSAQENNADGSPDAFDETGTNSKLEEIAKLWLATESILLLEKFIPKKRYLQDRADENFRL